MLFDRACQCNSGVGKLRLCSALDIAKLDTRSDEIDMGPNVLGERVSNVVRMLGNESRLSGEYLLVGSHSTLAGQRMLIDMIASVEQILNLGNSCVDLHPLLVRRLENPVSVNSSRDEPSVDRVFSLRGRGEEIVDFILRVVFAVLRRSRIRSELGVSSISELGKSGNSSTYTSIRRSSPRSRFCWVIPMRIDKT
jgi:hypothetical protein